MLAQEMPVLTSVRKSATPWTRACQAPSSMGFSGQECWSGSLSPSPGALPDPGTEPQSLLSLLRWWEHSLHHLGSPKRCLNEWVKVAQSCPTLCHPRTIQSMGFSRPECWSGQPFPSPGDLPNPGLKPRSPALHKSSIQVYHGCL